MNTRISEDQKLKAVREVAAGGKTVKEVCAELQIQTGRFYTWKAKLNGTASHAGTDEESAMQSQFSLLLDKVNALKDENDDLKGMYMDLLLKHKRLEDLLEKKS